MVNRGDLWWVELPEQKGRPYLVMSRNVVLTMVNRVIAVPLTTTIRGIPTEVALGTDEGLPQDCVASMDNIENIPRWAFVERVGEVPGQKMIEACRALQIAIDC
jgi:mRNA interferase MazF